MSSPKTISFKTFGCKVNTYDTGLLEQNLKAEGFSTTSSEEAGVFLFNSCAVTHEATKDLIREVKKTKLKNPNAKVVITGCSAQVDGKHLDLLSEVDVIIANSHKADVAKIISSHLNGEDNTKVFRSNIFRKEDLGLGGGAQSAHTRSFLKIQDGCNSFCSFCIIPYARGKSQSLSVDYLIHKIDSLAKSGVEEVVLSGIHIGDYEDTDSPGGPYKLEDLIEQVLKGTSVSRIRLGSLEPIEMTDKLYDLFSDDRLCSHLHMSIQSANTKVLQDMKRKYSSEMVMSTLEKIYKKIKNPFVGMDVITGFPGESESEFLDTYENLKKSPWTRIHVFPYSERSGTRAALSEQVVPWEERKARAKKINELSRERFAETALKQLGESKKVLLLNSKRGSQGLARDYWPVEITNAHAFPVGKEVTVQVKGYRHTKLVLNPIQLQGEISL